MAPPSTTLNPAGTPSLAECASRFQCAVPSACQMPFRSGLRSGVRGPLYAEGVWPAIPIVNRSRPAAAPTVSIGFFIVDRESLPQTVRGPATLNEDQIAERGART